MEGIDDIDNLLSIKHEILDFENRIY
jgi:hypothetical protein